MSDHTHAFIEGERVRATTRPGFPHGTVVRLLKDGFVLVRWDGDVLETAYHAELARSSPTPGADL